MGVGRAFERACETLNLVFDLLGDEAFRLVAGADGRKVRGKHAKQVLEVIEGLANVVHWRHEFPECLFEIASKTREPVLHDLRSRLIAARLPLSFRLYEWTEDGVAPELRWEIAKPS